MLVPSRSSKESDRMVKEIAFWYRMCNSWQLNDNLSFCVIIFLPIFLEKLHIITKILFELNETIFFHNSNFPYISSVFIMSLLYYIKMNFSIHKNNSKAFKHLQMNLNKLT